MDKKIKKINIVTHDQSFHADDVFTVATLSILNKGKIKIQRTRSKKLIEKADFVLDVGGIYDGKTRFDHHQEEGAGIRANGTPFATFGLIWKKFGTKVCGSQKIATCVEKRLVQFIDTQDNGVDSFRPTKDFSPYTISDLIASLNPTWNEKLDYDKSFNTAVKFAEKIILREIAVASAKLEAEGFIKKAYEKSQDKKILVLNKNYAWKDSISDYPEVLFVVYPKGSLWRANAVRKNNLSFDSKKPFPKSWAGKTDETLSKISGVPDAKFCHRKLFLAVADSKEGAIKLAMKAKEQ